MINNLSPIVRKKFEEYKSNLGSPLEMSEHELFLHSFCRLYDLGGEVRSIGSNKYYYIINHPTFTLESKIIRSDYLEVVSTCIENCDTMLRALLEKEEKEEKGVKVD